VYIVMLLSTQSTNSMPANLLYTVITLEHFKKMHAAVNCKCVAEVTKWSVVYLRKTGKAWVV